MKQLNKQQAMLDHILYRELDPAFARRARILIKELELDGKETVLEIGCGRGFYEAVLTALFPRLSIKAIDTNETYLTIARKSVTSSTVSFENQDALALTYQDNSFDRVFATEVLEHLPDDELALKEMYRVLKPKGIAIITVPNSHYPFLWDPLNWILEHTFRTHISKNIWWLAGIWADHVRLYTQVDLYEKARQAGFEVEMIWRSTHAALPFTHFVLYGIGKNLVEKGLLKEFYRFSITAQPSPLLRLLRSIIYSQDYRNQDSEPAEISSVNLIMKLRKRA